MNHSDQASSRKEFYQVLIVEDDRQQAQLVQEFLQVAGPFRMKWSENISGLWNSLALGQYDIILIDYRLPDGNGIDAIGEMRRHGYDIPVIMITGQGDERLAVQAIQFGAVDYLVKGSDYLPKLPMLIQKAVHAHGLQRSVQHSLDQVRYQALLLNNVRDAVVVWNTEGKITYWNPAAEALFEVRATERLGQSVEECYFPVFQPSVRQPPREGTSGQEIERRYKLQDGRSIWISSRVSALRDFSSEGRLIGYMDVSRDITGRKKAEDALRAERNFVSTVLDTVSALVVVIDANGLIVRFNRACEQITGYTFDEVRGKPIWDLFILPEEAEKICEVYSQLLAGRFPNTNESTWVTRSGARRLIAWSNTGLTDQGQVRFIIATGIDITERKQAEALLLESNRALRESEARYRTISETISDFVYALRVHPDYTITCEWITDAFEQVTGYAPNEIDWQKDWLKFIHSDDNAVVRRIRRRLITCKKDIQELKIITKHGEVRWVRNYAQPVWDETENRVVRIYGAAKDITERKQMEAQIQAAHTRLTQSARLAAIGELAAGVAHHINNPLTTIIAESQLLLQSLPEAGPARESADAIEQAGWRVQKAVQQLVDFSRPPDNTLELLSINESVARSLDLVKDQINSPSVQLEINLAQDLPPVRGNARQLSDLWVSLFMLARDATSDGQPHRIQICTRQETSASIGVEMSDDGRPISSEEMATLFEPRFTHPVGGRGTGIELNLCQEIVRQHRGQIRAESSTERGTIFQIILPAEVES